MKDSKVRHSHRLGVREELGGPTLQCLPLFFSDMLPRLKIFPWASFSCSWTRGPVTLFYSPLIEVTDLKVQLLWVFLLGGVYLSMKSLWLFKKIKTISIFRILNLTAQELCTEIHMSKMQAPVFYMYIHVQSLLHIVLSLNSLSATKDTNE